ncbi:hypothetical protein F4559_001413 [Saccharothrix violaceirubra]|uniref:Uncharacterized protein n=1 Tax=Saccharothrix violaceirubra TaxID=413306 RepID=A0A7W7WUB3_9PSEU|nr:hypothetical protein [Saccharothrix violaceirubra]
MVSRTFSRVFDMVSTLTIQIERSKAKMR